MIKELKRLMTKWNELGNKYTAMAKEKDSLGEKIRLLEKGHGYYVCSKELREALLKCKVDLKRD